MALILLSILPMIYAKFDDMKAFACSELASIAFEMDLDLIEEIGIEYDHDLVELSNYVVSNTFENCMNSMPHSLAV